MISKIILLLISISFILMTKFITFSFTSVNKILIVKLLMMFISLLSLTVFFVKSKRFQNILDNIKQRKRFVIVLFLIGSVFILTKSFILHSEDGDYVVGNDVVSYFIQARIFSTGSINVPSHELKDFFTTAFCINDGKYYGKYFPGWPAFLAIGIKLGLPWIINPIFGFFTLIIIYFIGKEIYDKETGIFASLLLLFSPSYFTNTPNYLSHTSTLFFSTLFFYLTVKTIKAPKVMTSLLAGLSLNIAFLIRPYPTIAVSLPILIYLFFISLKKKKLPIYHLGIIALAIIVALLILLAYNYIQTGSVFLTPMEYYNPFDKLGFGLRSEDISIEPKPYTIMMGLKNMFLNLALLNINSVRFLFIFLFFVLISKKDKWDIILFGTILTIIVFHLFYFARYTRYYYASFFALFLLAARGIKISSISFIKMFPDNPVKSLHYLILFFIAIANIFIIINPQSLIRDYELYKKARGPFNLVKENNLRNAVIFLKTGSNPQRNSKISFYVQNPLNFDGDILFVKDLKERNAELMGYYPEKEFYTYEFDQKVKSGRLTRLR